MKQALKKAMTMRDLTTSQCVPYVVQPNLPLTPRQMVDWSTSTSMLAGQEVRAGMCNMGPSGAAVVTTVCRGAYISLCLYLSPYLVGRWLGCHVHPVARLEHYITVLALILP